MCLNQTGTCERKLWPEDGYKRDYARWVQYFHCNNRHLMNIPWEDDYMITAEERKTIAKSIAVFQLGEGTDGTFLLKLAEKFARESGETFFVDALKFFVGEEQRHSHMLGQFMWKQKIPFITKQWTDKVFHLIGGHGDVYTILSLLLAAELIASSYYQALRKVTRSPALHVICDQILRDEKQHIFFQCVNMARLRPLHRPWSLLIHETFHRTLITGTILAVWHDHRVVLKAGGYTLLSFAREVWSGLIRAFAITRTCSVLQQDRQRGFQLEHTPVPSTVFSL